MEWQGRDLVLFFKDLLAARRIGKVWFPYLPFAVTEKPDGMIGVEKISKEALLKERNVALNRILKDKPQKQTFKIMERLGFGKGEQVTFGEAYHDAVKRGDDPEEIAWLKEQWMNEKGQQQ
jgi:hypothetical protein